MRHFILISVLLMIGYFGFNTVASAKHPRTFVCWASPTEKAKNECKSCSGAGTYAWHSKRVVAEKLAVSSCEKEFGDNNCVLEYCEEQE